jgi:hypothetical protein
MGLFSTKKSTSTSTTVSQASDLRTGVESMTGGTLIGPKAIVGAAGGVTTGIGDYSTMSQYVTGNAFKVGMSGTEVKDLLGTQASLADKQISAMTEFGSAALASVNAGRAAELAAVTGTLPNWQKYIPYAIAAAVAIAIWRKH